MTKEERAEEWIKQNCCECCVNKDDCDAGTIDCFAKQAFLAGYETGKDEAEADLATVAYMQGAERYKKELAKRAEQIEALNKDKDYFSDALDKQIETTYKVVEKLNKAKGIVKALLNVFVYDLAEDELDSVDIVYIERAEKFLKDD